MRAEHASPTAFSPITLAPFRNSTVSFRVEVSHGVMTAFIVVRPPGSTFLGLAVRPTLLLVFSGEDGPVNVAVTDRSCASTSRLQVVAIPAAAQSPPQPENVLPDPGV